MNKLISYGKQWIDEEDKRAVLDVLESDFLTQGPKVEEFEQTICKYTGAKYCVAVSNGTAALHLAVACLDIKKGYEGITTPITFVASANCLIYNGLTPVFADIDDKTYNIDPEEIEKAITRKTKVIIPVDFAGQAADMKKIYKLARKKNIFVVEDAAHAIGSCYADGSKVGSCKYSTLTTFSFHPVKNITTGEGGAITTNDKKLYKKLLLLRSHGITKKPEELSQNPGPWYQEMQILGYNYRMCDIQAAIGVTQIKKLEKFKKRRRDIVARYNKKFKDLKKIKTPFEAEKLSSAFHLYILKIDFDQIGKSRAEIMAEFRDHDIGTQVFYIPVPFHPYYKKNYPNQKRRIPKSIAYYNKALALPLYPKMSEDDVTKVIKVAKKILDK